MSARQRVSRRDANIKREELGTSAKDEDMEQAQDDELEQAEARMKMNKGKKYSPAKKRPEKAKRQSSQQDEKDSEDESDDEYDSEEMNDFIAGDEEVEAEMIEHQERERKKLRRQHKREKDSGKRAQVMETLCEDDLDVIRENVGLDVKKKTNRLKRMAAVEADDVFKEETMQIDTFTRKTKVKNEKKEDVEMVQINTAKTFVNKTKPENLRGLELERPQQIDPDRLRQAHDIFGDDDEEPEMSKVEVKTQSHLQEMFNADDINDPFSTELDNRIAENDIPERLQVRLQDRIKPTEDELRKESEWVLDRLTCMTGDTGKRYGKLLNLKDIREKIFRVLKMFRIDLLDIPMIVKYRRYEYAEDIDEEAVWLIYNFDQEYGKFQRHKAQIKEFLARVIKFDPRMKIYEDELAYAKNQSELNNFTALIRFLRSFFSDKLLQEDPMLRRKQPQRRDEVQVSISSKLQEFASLCFLSWAQLQENIQLRKLSHKPPEPRAHPSTFASQFQNDQFPDELAVFQGVCKYAAVELSAQPIIRDMMKKALKEHGQLSTTPTEQGKKDLDLFHLSYRVKNVNKLALKDLFSSDLYLDIAQCEKSNLVTVKIELDPSKKQDIIEFLEENYMAERHVKESWNIMRAEVITILVNKILEPEIIKEVRDEIREEAESFVVSKCKNFYKELLMTGPFQTTAVDSLTVRQPEQKKKGKSLDGEIIKDRERLCVMGALMHQIDANNYIVTIAVVDRFGDLVAHKDFIRMLPPRQRKPQGDKDAQQAANDRPQPKTDEENEHERDKAKLISILQQHSVDLIVVAANGLEARNLKRVMGDIAVELKNHKAEEVDKSGKRVEPVQGKEAFVIWGSTEVAKLFAMSHNSQKLHKGVQQILKQTISLARFEQDPLVEILNLWSPITAENQALMLTLDPMQKLVNQAKLSDGLEEVNIQVVNEIGVDFNLIIEHEHTHCLLQFLSGLGPRMSKRLISKTKSLGKKLHTRGEMLKSNLLQSGVYMSLVPFIKIRIPQEDYGSTNYVNKFDILDQTRIHHEHYKLAMKIATDAFAEDDSREVEKAEQNRMCKEIISQPERLKHLDLKQYFQQLEMTNMGNMRTIIEQIISEFNNPFKDPRQARIPTKSPSISNERLFYLLIDETPRTFKKGLIVTATVTKVLDTKVICRLENGLNAIISQQAILEDSNEKLKDIVEIGHIVTGRIDKINTEDDKRFEVNLHCKKKDLQSHAKYAEDLAMTLGVTNSSIPATDLQNANFSIDQQPKQLGRFVPRRIAHEKFKNISSRRALAELHEADVGDFVFRPSTRDDNHITLTWKFWKKHFVHIDIAEHDKHPGSAIGSRLVISTDYFENLREIVERYIIPCNRLVRDVISHPKWSDLDKWEEFEESLKSEKAAEKTRIPYRFAILPQYPQHVVLAYVPREKVVKEFIKVRPKGYFFHEQNLTPFISLVNWFKETWSSKDYQRQLRRQKSPRTAVKAASLKQITPGEGKDDFGQSGREWQAAGGNSAHGDVKQEQRSFGRGQRSARKSSPGGGWADQRDVKHEGNKSPGGWGQDDGNKVGQSPAYNNSYGRGNGGGNRDGNNKRECFKCHQEGHIGKDCPNSTNQGSRACFKCNQEGHFSRECPNPDTRPPKKSTECYKCHQEGHISRECPNQQGDDRGFKRQRRDDGGSNRRDEGWLNNNDAKPSDSGWEDSKPNEAAKQDHAGWGDAQANNGSGW